MLKGANKGKDERGLAKEERSIYPPEMHWSERPPLDMTLKLILEV